MSHKFPSFLLFRSSITLRSLHLSARRQIHSMSASGSSEIRPATLESAWPKLVERFRSNLNENGQFQLLTVKQQEQFAKNYKWDKKVNLRQAAVLVLITSVKGVPSLIFTKRAKHLALHAAEISFPGGHFDSGVDTTLQDTALRETKEELVPPPQLLEHHVEILGSTCPLPSLNGTPVTPVVAILWTDLSHPVCNVFPGDPSEVDIVFSVSIQDLANKETSQELPKNRFGLTMAPVFPTEYGKIWGLTSYILRPLLHELLIPFF